MTSPNHHHHHHPILPSSLENQHPNHHPFDRTQLDGLLIKRFFYAPAFEHYGGVAGLYDYGPPGSALQSNILNEWRRHFIIDDDMLELDTTCITPADVLKTSGHVDKFSDSMVRDTITGDIFRADHLVQSVLQARLQATSSQQVTPSSKKIKQPISPLSIQSIQEYHAILAQIDNYSGPQLGQLIITHNITAPDTGNPLSPPVDFNLMFESQIGPTGQLKGYLRPETAQGHFLNFNRLLEFNNGKLPFASAQIGRSFRNEISPKQGLLRVREFTMAEIEHFVDPNCKLHPRFDQVSNISLNLLPKHVQSNASTQTIQTSIAEAVSQGIVDNQTLGYFLVRIYQFLIKIGIDPLRLRFRQHMANEMAHYATDCWDAEILSSYGWIECVGCADRSAYDLTVHSVRTGTKLVVREPLKEVIEYEKSVPVFDKKLFGPRFKKDAKIIEQTVLALDQNNLMCISQELMEKGSSKVKVADGKEYELGSDILKIERRTFKETTREFTPNVIEPSFGIGRILYSLLEHSFWTRKEDVNRGVLSLPPSIAPIKVLIVPLSGTEVFRPIIKTISDKLRKAGIAHRIDDSNASIGKRYARNDELGTPFGVTVDFGSVKNGTVTLRERDSTKQLIGEIDSVLEYLDGLCKGSLDWQQVSENLPEYSGTQDID